MTRLLTLAGVRRTAAAAVLAAACLLVAPRALAIAHPHREVHKEIEALENQWRTALLSNDWKTMESLLDDEYTGISVNGQIQTKEQAIAARKAGTLVLKKLSFSDVKVHVQPGGSAAVVTSRADLVGSNGGEDISGRYRYMRVYEKKLGEWHIVNFIATRIDDHEPQPK
jgi:ketosteroid isomerase-like protein